MGSKMSVKSSYDQPLENTPTIPLDIIRWLESAFPLTSPTLDDSEREIFVRVGQRSVVEHLTSVYREQNDNLLEL
jgi:hypothetical protein